MLKLLTFCYFNPNFNLFICINWHIFVFVFLANFFLNLTFNGFLGDGFRSWPEVLKLFLLSIFSSLIPTSCSWIKKDFFFFFFYVTFHLLRVVLTFKQNKTFGRIIIILPYLSEELSNLPIIFSHIFPQRTLKGNFPKNYLLWVQIN